MCAIHEITNDGNYLKLRMYDPYTQVKISWSGNEQAASAYISVVIFFPFTRQGGILHLILLS